MRRTPRPPSPLQFFAHIKWIDGRLLLDTMEHYRREIFDAAFNTFRDDGTPKFNFVLSGRAKKNWKSADLDLAALYKLLVPKSPQGNDCLILANDEDQAGDDLDLAKKIVRANPNLASEVDILAKEIKRKDGRGSLQVLPARDVAGAHGKTALFIGFDEIHGYRNWDLFEALAPDPTRPDTLTWVTSYASIWHAPGVPLYDMLAAAKRGDDPRMLFSWYAADHCTDPAFDDLSPEERANPSMASWAEGPAYLEQQRQRLPTHKYRRLHLNLPGAPSGAFLSTERVMEAIVSGRRSLPPDPVHKYAAFVDMSGGSNDDATLAIAHKVDNRAVLDVVMKQAGEPPFDPRAAVARFAGVLKEYGLRTVTGDRYAGETFRRDFEAHEINYVVARKTATELYEALEPRLNAGEIELLDVPKLQEQLLSLIVRGAKVTHPPADHDDWCNAAAGAIWKVLDRPRFTDAVPCAPKIFVNGHEITAPEPDNRPARAKPDNLGCWWWDDPQPEPNAMRHLWR